MVRNGKIQVWQTTLFIVCIKFPYYSFLNQTKSNTNSTATVLYSTS